MTVTIPLRRDDELSMWVLTEEAHRIIDDTKAFHMGLLVKTRGSVPVPPAVR